MNNTEQKKTLRDLSDIEIKAFAFEKIEHIKQLQQEYNAIYENILQRQFSQNKIHTIEPNT
jgi:hypothetical protein